MPGTRPGMTDVVISLLNSKPKPQLLRLRPEPFRQPRAVK
jgi:hypothetical protein